MHGDFLSGVYSASEMGVDLRAKIGHYRNRCFFTIKDIFRVDPNHDSFVSS